MRKSLRRILLSSTFFFLSTIIFATQVSAATITVTDRGDSGAGTLRQASYDVEDGDTIDFNLSAGNETIVLSSAISNPWSKDVIIDGDNTAGSGTNITIQVSSPGSSPYPTFEIHVGSGKTATLRNLTLRGGRDETGSGGTIEMWSPGGSSLVLENCVVKDGRGRFGAGLWAYAFDSLTITDTIFQNNTSTEHGAAARIDGFAGTVTITNSTFDNNNATLTGGNYYGGALYFQNNSTQGTVNIDKTTFSNNSVYTSGGGIYATNLSSLAITNSTFTGNEARSAAGLYMTSVSAATISNSTFTGNTSYYSGGAISASNSVITLTNSTISNNNATASDNDGFYLSSGTLYVKNTIFANHTVYDFMNSGGTVYNNGYNIVENSFNDIWYETGDITENQASLNLSSSLADNSTVLGTQTLALSSGSVAINAGNAVANNGVTVTARDQRGLYRAGTVDIGAYEFAGTVSAPSFTLTYTGGSNGSITGTTPQTVNLGSDGSAITPTPNTGYHFVNWSDSSTANPRTDENIFGDVTVTANFAINTFDLSYSARSNGSLTGTTSQTVNYNTNGSEITAVPASNYHFVNWSDSSTVNPRTDTSVTENITVTASFAIDTFDLNYSADSNGSITGTSSQTVDYNTDGSEVVAVPNTGYHFVDWSDSSTVNPRTDTGITENLTVTANFAIDTFTLAYTAGDNGTVTGTASQTIDYGSDGSTVTAVPSSNYAFVKWSDDSVENPRTDINVTENFDVTATFEIIDPEAPTKTTFVINDDDAYTNSTTIILTIVATDARNDVTHMMISNSVLFPNAEWVEYTTAVNWTLTEEDEEKEVYIKFKDSVGNISLTYSDSITLDTITPSVTESSNESESGFTVTSQGRRETRNQKPTFSGTGERGATVTITINSDPIIGTTIIDDDGTWAWTPEEEIPLGEHTVTIVVEDLAGNTEEVGYVLGVLDEELAKSGSNVLQPIVLSIFTILTFYYLITTKENLKYRLQSMRKSLSRILLSITFFFLATIFTTQVSAATITVTSNGNSGAGTLRQATLDVADGDTIDFSLGAGSETIVLSSEINAPWSKDVTIDGDNAAGSGTNITIQVATPGSSTYPVFDIRVGSGKTATLKNLTMRGGNATTGSGGTIFMYSSGASLILENCVVKDGRGRFGAGMWAYDFNSLTITDTVFQDNTSTEHGGAARIDGFSGTVTITNSTFTNNTSTLTGGNYYGGGLYFQNNSVQGTVNIDKSTFSGNSVYSDGGGIYAKNLSSLTINNSTFTGNTNGAGTGNGGGLYSYGTETVTISNSTFTGNTCKYFGGAMYMGGSTSVVMLTNVTATNNSSSYYDYDGLYMSSVTLHMKNTLLADHAAYDFHNSSSTINDNGYNIVESSNGYTWSGTGDITGNQASLNISGSLADNSTVYGTQTLALSSGSVAINAGNSHPNNVVSITTRDQRGFYRADTVDIGAYEYNASATPIYSLTYIAGSNGTITGSSSQSVSSGNDGTAVTAVPASNYHFVDWSDSSTVNPRTDTSVTENITVTASFAIDTFDLNYSADSNGSITGTSSQTVDYNTDGSEVAAVPNTGYHFVDWSDSSTTNPRTDISVTENLTVTANFAIDTFTLAYAAGENGSITGTASQTIDYGSDGETIIAVPSSNYAFVKWSDDSVENPRTDINVTENFDVTATFVIVDPDAPTKTTFVINDDDAYTNSISVILTIAAADAQNDVTYMMISNSVLFPNAEWVEYTTAVNWTLIERDEEKNVYIKFKDSVGNTSLTYSDSITLDTIVENVEEESSTEGSDFTIKEEGRRETRIQKPTFSGTGEPGATVIITINSDPIIGTTTVDDDGTWAWTPEEEIPLGEHTVTIIVEDLAGNTEEVGYVLGVLDDELADTGSKGFSIFMLSIFAILSSSYLIGYKKKND